MNKPRPIQITIPHPCTQSWDEMTPDGQGRHCTHCQKTVIDFTTWGDTSLYNYFAKDDGNTCGRFLSTQLNRRLSIPYQPHSRLYRMTVALGLTLLFSQTPHLLAQTRPPIAAQMPDSNKYKDPAPRIQMGGGQYLISTSGGTYQPKRGIAIAPGVYNGIAGQVMDEHKEPIINATVQVYQNGMLRGGAITDIDGLFSIRPLDPGEYEIRIHYVGYDSVTAFAQVGSSSKELKLYMRSRHQVLGGPIVRRYSKPLPDKEEPTKRTFDRNEIDHIPQ